MADRRDHASARVWGGGPRLGDLVLTTIASVVLARSDRAGLRRAAEAATGSLRDEAPPSESTFVVGGVSRESLHP